MANKNSDQTNDKNKHQTDYILYDLIIKDENYKLKSIMINLELNLRKIFKSIAIDPHKLKVLCKLNKSDDLQKYDKDLDMKDVFLVPDKYSEEDIEFKTSIIEDEILDMIKKKFENKSIDQFFEETFGLELNIDKSKNKIFVSGVNFQIKLMYKFMDELKKEYNMSDTVKKSKQQNVPTNSATSNHRDFSIIINNVKVLVYQESITNLKVDAIVNSIDDQMNFQNRFGLCKAIYDKYGPNIEIECNRVAKLSLKRQPVSGDCIIVRSGKIKPSFIINAVSPTPGQKNMEKVLKMTFENIFKLVHNNPDIRTVAIPLLSTGCYGLDKVFCSKILFDSIINSSNLDLEEIHLVNIDFESTQALVNELYNVSQTKNNNNFYQKNNENENKNESILRQDNKQKESSPNKSKNENAKDFKKKELLNCDKSTDDFTRTCDVCGQRIRVYMKLYKCDHAYCMGCRIDYVNNQKSCLLSHDEMNYNPSDESNEINESMNKMDINDSADKIEEQASSKISENNQKAEDADSNLCSICYTCDNEVKLNKCEHSLCKTCYDRIMKTNPICPFCKTIYGVLSGDQPKNGHMSHIITSHILPGFPNSNTIQINYRIPNGIQGPNHPNPGQTYNGINRTAYLPNNHEGNHILKLLYKAFENGLTFTIGNSRTTNEQGVITWNDIHHKTQISGQYGYPDPDYLDRVKMELKERGIE